MLGPHFHAHLLLPFPLHTQLIHRSSPFSILPSTNLPITVFIPPFNLLEFTLLIAPFSWWLPKPQYTRLATFIMGTLYAPLLAIISVLECRQARRVRFNRRRGQEDEDTTEEWEVLGWEVREEDEAWCERVEGTVPDVAGSVDGKVEKMINEIKELREMVEELARLAKELGGNVSGNGNESDAEYR